MSLRQRPPPTPSPPPPSRSGRPDGGEEEEVYNIIPVHNLLADHPSLNFPEVRAAAAAAAAAALRSVGDLRRPPFATWRPHHDLLDWLALFFGFQADSVRNQREHLVLHLANLHMQLSPPPDNTDSLDPDVVRRFRKKLLKNYSKWCAYLGKKSNVWISDRRPSAPDPRRELLYVSLYLLIWGEAANLRFMPECICYIFHNMAMELNKILEDYIDEATGQPVLPSFSGENAFLNMVVKPIYETVKAEVEGSKNGTAPHRAWRNYDDINEYFWSKRCFEKLKWPLDGGSNFFVTSARRDLVGKTGFVEQRSFWNLFRSFDRLWVMLALFLQAAIIVAWEGKEYPWQALESRDVQVRVLTVFITWSGMRFLQSLLDIGMQYRLVSRETMGLGVRMVLKSIAAAVWIIVFGQLRLRFQFFASAIQFNLMPEEKNTRGNLKSKLNDAIHRLKLRYGLGRPFKKLESNQVEARKFALIWNEIISIFREEDIVSDHEVELLELPPNTWNVRVVRWPCFLLCNELLLALGQAKELVVSPDKWLWYKVCKNEFRRCAVIETYDSVKHLLLKIIKVNSEEHSIMAVLFQEIDHSIEIKNFTKSFKTTALPQIHSNLIKLVELLIKPKKDLSKVVNTLQALYEIAIRDFLKEKRTPEQLEADGLASSGLLFENAVILPEPDDEKFYRQVRRLHTILTSRDSMHDIPVNLEARRRIAFFSNSLFMNMPHAPQVEKMMAFSVLTPYYNEEVVFSREQLRTENEDGISILYYLQTIYDDEWKNFMERMRREGMVKDDEIWTTKLRDLRLWASYRGQTLGRTVRGMMYYHRALKMLVFLDSASETDVREGSVEHGSTRRDGTLDSFGSGSSPSSKSLSRASSSVSTLFKGHEDGTAMMKFTYVVACQIYGAQKAKKDPHADEILNLMKNNEALRVAYVDEVSTKRDEKEYYSVLVKYDQKLQKEVEIYRVKLPGPVKLGEGKPENQNHALIFTRGDAVQTIDMNQDNYFEEALKMRNLLEEYRAFYGIRKPTILGVREHIFTGLVSSLAWFMSAQETSFVTLGQRVLANPLKIRMHYGHPDVFDRFWFLSRGGISKASRVINISEDIFAGFNCTLRGGNVTHHEYIQVGKGRDVGLNQVSMFEAKVASGNGEQVLSRDVYRLGHRLDFFRMLSFFYTTVGFFFNTMLVILTVYTFLWGRLYLVLSGVEAAATSSDNRALGTILNQQLIIQLGLFTALPMIVENSLELGFLQALWDFITMQLQLSSVFYTFSMGTRTHFFGRTILHGGAKYRATGRGFVVQHKSFAENYRLYARSHFVKAIELGLILTVYATDSPIAKDTLVYITLTITSWFLVMSWIMAPFVFNPSGFVWLKTVYDFDDFMNWIWYRGGVFAKAEQSWERWWYEEQDHFRTTGFWGKIFEIILDLRFFFFQYGIVYQIGIAAGSTSIAVYLLSWIFVFVAFGVYWVISYAQDKYAAKYHIYYRLVQFLVIILVILLTIALLEFTKFKFMDIFTSLLAFIPTGWGIILIAQVLRPFLRRTKLWDGVVSVARMYDIMFGVIVMAPVACLSLMPGCQSMQTRILFNEAFSRGLLLQIVTGKKSKVDS
ncbi:hypothetical protein EUGRSUZ_K01027 [Eucalyptus grandis]|uniref:Uncharacterized protein n=1 Tax=Eucalyptus grandis TaxID=71139 RepID=A0ACC3ISZ5_EUCGR|nr:hypothetical protein EUGRSUZ_K01027 [Eucalyptus grandis]